MTSCQGVRTGRARPKPYAGLIQCSLRNSPVWLLLVLGSNFLVEGAWSWLRALGACIPELVIGLDGKSPSATFACRRLAPRFRRHYEG